MTHGSFFLLPVGRVEPKCYADPGVLPKRTHSHVYAPISRSRSPHPRGRGATGHSHGEPPGAKRLTAMPRLVRRLRTLRLLRWLLMPRWLPRCRSWGGGGGGAAWLHGPPAPPIP